MMIYQFHFFDFENITHGITSRNTADTSKYGSFNLATHVGDNPQKVASNRDKLAITLGVKAEQVVFADQTHSVNVGVVNSIATELTDTDAMITNQKGICLNVLTADCVPVILFDPVKNVIGVVHAGWKGTMGEITRATVLKMKEVYDVESTNLLAGIGPCISFENYEVGEEVASQFSSAFYYKKRNNKYLLDLVKANSHQLSAVGVKSANIEVMNICTRTSQRFYSARREGIQSGRFSTFILLK